MGNMAIVGRSGCDNLTHIVFNNAAHDSVGGQPTIAGEIDFEKIHKYMKWSKWKWATSKSDDGVPTIEELKSQVRDLIADAIKRKTTISTGGFTVEYREYEENEEDPSTIGVIVSFNCGRVTVDINKDTLEAVYF